MRFIYQLVLDALFPPRDSERVVRALNVDTLSFLVMPTLITQNTRPITSLLLYADMRVKACIVETKFHDNRRAAQLLASALHDYLIEFIANHAPLAHGPITLIPIPLSAKRRRERGYNQVERVSRLAIRGLEQYIGIGTDLLVRIRDTRPQTELNRTARQSNIKGAFAIANAPHRLNPQTIYILLDDVITTGSTMRAAASELYKGGARNLILLSLAHQD